jgi:hypothetical protein
MAYTLKLTNGKILLNLADQTTDNLSTSLTLIGKNVPSYGTKFNENLIYLLENFANSSEPNSPLVGQLWYNSAVGRMFVYNQNNQFRPVGGPIVSSTIPSGVVAGDLWLDSTNKQLNVFDGNTFITAGPQYSAVQGKAGWVVEQILATDVQTYTVSSLYNNGTLLAILSEQAFTPAVPYKGISQVAVGLTFNNSIPGIAVVATATNASAIANVDSTKFLQVDAPAPITRQLWISTSTGILIGNPPTLELYNDGTLSHLYSLSSDVPLDLTLTSSNLGTISAINMDPASRTVKFWNGVSNANVNVNGDMLVTGNLTVIGTGTNAQVRNLEVDNINIELAYPPGSLPDGSVDGGGLILHGTVDHSLLFRAGLPGWESSDSFNLVGNKAYYINNTRLLDQNALYVTSAPNLTAIGLLNVLNVGHIQITTSSIATIDGSNLQLGSLTSGNIDAAGKSIDNLKPITVASSSSTAATKYYVDNIQSLKNANTFVFSLDVSGISDVDLFVLGFLNKMLPIGTPSDFYYIPDSARCRVNCMSYVILPQTNTGVSQGTYVPVDQNGIKDAVQVLSGVTVQTTTQAAAPSVVQQIRQYLVTGGVWVVDGIIS